MSGTLVNILNKVLGSWIENLNTEQFSLSIFSGVVELDNLKLKPDIFQILGLPIKLLSGTIGHVKLKIPWSAWYSSPLEIDIENVIILLSPNSPDNWDENDAKDLILKNKKYLIDQFEVMHSDGPELMKNFSFLGSLTSKVIDNLCVQLRNVYVRYEDKNTFLEPFAAGLYLKKADFFTTNDNWQAEYYKSEADCFKLLLIDKVSLFVDYEDGIIIAQEWFEGSVQEVLTDLASEESEDKVDHKFMLYPFSARAELTLAKAAASDLKPKVSINASVELIKIDLNTHQIKILVKFQKFLTTYSNYIKGLEHNLLLKKFDRQSEIRYQVKYRKMRKRLRDGKISQEKIEKLKLKIDKLENGILASDILMQRRLALTELKMDEIKVDKEKEINEVKNAGKRRFTTKLVNFFNRKSDAEIEHEENVRNQRLTIAQNDLKRLFMRTNSIIKQVSSNLTEREPETLIKWAIDLSVNLVSIVVKDASHDYLDLQISTILIKTLIRPYSQKLHFSMSDTILVNLFDQSEIFPKFLDGKQLLIEYDTFGTKYLKILSNGLSVCLDLNSLLHIVTNIKQSFSMDKDWVKYLEGVSDTTERYAMQGSQYLREAIETGVNTRYELEIDIKAPIIVIPTDIHNASAPIIVFDLGKLSASTHSRSLASSDYHVYKFFLDNFKIYTENLTSEFACIIEPSKLTIQMFTSKVINSNDPHFYIRAVVNQIKTRWTDSTVSMLGEFYNKYNEIYSVVYENADKFRETSVTERKPETLKSVYQLQIGEISALVAIKENPMVLFSAENIKSKVQVLNETKNTFRVLVGVLKVVDLRQDLKSNVLWVYRQSNDDSFEDAQQRFYQVMVSGNADKKNNILDVTCKVTDLHLMLKIDFLQALQSISSDFQEKFTDLSIIPLTPTVSLARPSTVYINNQRFSIQFENLHIKCPVQGVNTWESADFTMNMSLTSVYEEKGDKKVNRHGIEVWKQMNESKSEVNVMLNHFGLKVSQGLYSKTIIDSSRISVDFTKLTKFRGLPETNIQTRMESLAMVLGFRDLDYLFTVRSHWFTYLFPKSNTVAEYKSVHTIDFDSLQVTIQEDTIKDSYSLAFLQFSNFIYTISNESGHYQCLLTCVFFMDFYNLKTGIWEPLVEDWKFSYSVTQINPEKPYETILESKDILNINVTKYMCDTIGIIYKRYYQTTKDWESIEANEIPQRKTLDYQIVNKLGIDVKIWFLDKGKDLVLLNDGACFDVEFCEMRKIFSKKRPKSKFEAGKIFVHEVNLEPDGFSQIHGLVLEDIGIEKFLLVNQNEKIVCRKSIEITKNLRIVTFLRDFIVSNLSGAGVSLFCGFEKIRVNETEYFLPISWELSDINIQTCNGLRQLTFCPIVELSPSVFVSIQIYNVPEIDPLNSSKIIILAPFSFTNTLPCTVHIWLSLDKVATIYSGDTFLLTISQYSPSLEFSVELDLVSHSIHSETFEITQFLSTIPLKNKPGWEIQALVACTETSSTVKLYSQYLLINSTEFPLAFNTLNISPNELCFLNYAEDEVKLKTCGEFSSNWSEKFNPKAVGVASCLFLKLSNPIIKTLTLGVKLTQAPFPLQMSKIIKIVPRFIIVNYLDFKIYIRQHCKSTTRIVEIESNKNIQYQFDDIEHGSLLQVSEDKLQWSGPFDSTVFEDFQIRFKAAPRPIPPKENIFAFDSFWYLPCVKNHLFFYIRVCVSSEDDACIKVTFSLPLIPAFKIHNSLSDTLQVKQSKAKSQFDVISPGTSLPWTFFDNTLENKKVTLIYGKYKQKYSLEKIKEKNKDLGPFLVSINFEGECRVLRVYEAEQTFSHIEIGLIKKVVARTGSKIQLLLTGIHFSLLDESNSEKFLISMKDVNCKSVREDEKRNKQAKVRVKYHLIIGGLQIDNMKIDKKLFPVMAFQSEIHEKTPFFEFRYDREFTTSGVQSKFFTPIDRILEFELQMQSLNLNLNIETLFSFINLTDLYYKSFYHILPQTRPIGHFPIDQIYPELSATIQISKTCQQSIKSYFKYIRIHGAKIILTFSNSESKSTNPELSHSLSEFFLDLASFENSNLKFTEIILQYSFQNFYNLAWILGKNYLRQGLLQFYRILGSSELLGNPLGLIDKLGTGVYEFFNEPAKGLLQGPKGFIHGFSKGVKSLVSNVVGGSFESVAKITGSLYKIVGKDKGYNGTLYEKLGIGDLANGVAGIVMKPYLGLKTKGASGFVIGMGAGVIGAVMSPVAAILHFSTTVTSQVAKTAGKLHNFHNYAGRARFPRYINTRRILEPYDHNLAKIWYFVSLKDFREHEILALIELEKEYIVVTKEKLYILIGEEIIDRFFLHEFFIKEIHLYNRSYLFKLSGHDGRFCISSKNYSPLLKLYEAIRFNKTN